MAFNMEMSLASYRRAEFDRDRIYARLGRLLASDSPDAVYATHASMPRRDFDALVEAVGRSNQLEHVRLRPLVLAPFNDTQCVDPDLLAESEDDADWEAEHSD